MNDDFSVFHRLALTILAWTRLIPCNEREFSMISTQTIRRPMVALIAGSAILLGGAAMPRFCLQNQTLLYVLGEVRMVVGDHDGGLQMIGFAANQSKDKAAATEVITAPKPAVENKD